MKNHTVEICVGILAAIAVAGCGGISEKDLIGSWTGELETPSSGGTAGGEGTPEAEQAMADAFTAMMSFDLELKSDHKFTLTIMMIPMEGNWELEGDEVTLTIEKVSGMSVDEIVKMGGPEAAAGQEPMVLSISEDGKTMTAVDPSGESPEKFVFKRKDDS
ncbi:MAG: hypothetical protein IH851_04925 [Armatimonadetes bacterium]|nr:hypothetical protein [Armatimonadota bacterium]